MSHTASLRSERKRARSLWLCVPLAALLVVSLTFASAPKAFGQSSGLLAYDPFTESPGPMNNGSSGTGWSSGWWTQNNDSSIPGYSIQSASPLQYGNLAQSVNYASGGSNYESVGRSLDVTANGPFANYLSSGLIGAPNTTLWFSCVLRKDADNEDQIKVVFVPGSVSWNLSPGNVSIGYFGTNSDSGGKRYWSLNVGGNVYQTQAAITVGQAVFLVLRIDFNATSTVSLYVNPVPGASDPGTPAAQATTTSNLAFNNLGWYAGDAAGDSSIDEIRFASDYADVAPVGNQLAAPTNLTATAGDSQINLRWQASAGAATYTIWGATTDGFSPVATGVTATTFGLQGLSDGTTYSYYVTAVNGNLTSSPSNTVSATPVLGGGQVVPGLLAYAPFDAQPGPLAGVSSGGGWAEPWQVQNGSTNVPGLNIASTNPLQAGNLPQSGNYGVGGDNYLGAGRRLDVTSNGPFASYLSGGLIGANGTTLWMSVLLRKDVENEDSFGVILHPGTTSWNAATYGPTIGYFGNASDSNGTHYWSLLLDGTVYQSNVPLITGQAALLVLRIDFGSTTTVSLYVNPPAGSSPPATANVQATSTNSQSFQSITYYGGSTAGESSIDEIRFAGSYQALDTTLVIPSQPTGVTATAGDGQVSLAWNPVSGASNYQIWVSTSVGPSQLLTTTSTPNFIHAPLTDGVPYTYQIVALNNQAASTPSSPVTAIPRAPAGPPHPALGTNLTAVVDWTREWPFVDIFKLARTWISQQQGAAWGQGPALALTSDGWPASLAPGQYAETIIYDNGINAQPDFPSGNYTIYYDGSGTIAFDLNSATIVSQSPGQMVVNVPAGEIGIFLMITQTDPTNPIRNIRFITPGYESTYQTQPFNSVFLSSLKNYKVLRFMEWMLTNGSNVANWTDRALPTDYTYTWRGVPLETMIQLANTLNVSPWFNIPAQATDDYVRQFATLVQQQLNPGLKVYIEYSNETWNGGFSQSQYVQTKGMAEGLSQNATQAGAFYTAQRSVQIFQIFAQVFGGTSRLVRVLPGQAANSWISQQVVSYQNAFAYADALAIAPYFDCDDTATGGYPALNDPSVAQQVSTLTVAQVLQVELSHINNCANAQMTSNASVAQQYGLKLVAYEGGQSLVANNGSSYTTQLTQLFAAANRDPGMQNLYDQYLQNWKNAGGDLFVHFTDVTSYTMYGEFGSMESQDQDPTTAPKYQSLMNFAAQNP